MLSLPVAARRKQTTDDNFASIVAGIREGRGVFDNIRKTLVYLLGGNMGELALMLGALFHIAELAVRDLLLAFALALVPVTALELIKLATRGRARLQSQRERAKGEG